MHNLTQLTQASLIQAEKRGPVPSKRRRRYDNPALRIAPLAWLKLRLFLHAGETEVGFFGISREDDLLYIQDIVLPRQTTTAVTVKFDDVSVADYFDNCADAGIVPARCGRIWIHTHPGLSAEPSMVDEETFERVFGNCDWAVMAIIARDGATFARLSFNAGPGGSVNLPIYIDWESMPLEIQSREGTLDELFSGWLDEYGQNVFPEEFRASFQSQPMSSDLSRSALFDPRDTMDELYDRIILEEQFEQGYCDSIQEGVFP